MKGIISYSIEHRNRDNRENREKLGMNTLYMHNIKWPDESREEKHFFAFSVSLLSG